MMYRANQRFQQGSLLALFYGDFQAVWLNTHGSFSPPPITLPIVLPIYLRMVCSAARFAKNRPTTHSPSVVIMKAAPHLREISPIRQGWLGIMTNSSNITFGKWFGISTQNWRATPHRSDRWI